MKRLMLLMIILLFAGAQLFAAAQGESGTSLPAAQELAKVRYMSFPLWNKTSKPFAESALVKQLSEMTNIEFVWEQMDSSTQFIEKQKIIIASGDFPDIMQLILELRLGKEYKA